MKLFEISAAQFGQLEDDYHDKQLYDYLDPTQPSDSDEFYESLERLGFSDPTYDY